MQRFVVLGINHKYAPLEVRERLAYADRRIPGALKSIRERAGCDEAVLLSTCNRVEAYAFTNDSDARARILQALAGDQSLKPEYLEQYCYFHRGRDAVEHLLRVAGGLDSLVLGETQVLNQVKKAYLLAQSENSTGKALNALFHRAFQSAKRLHTETGISEGQLSTSSIAVRFIKRVFEDLADKTALLIGVGEVGELTLTHLREAGIGRVIVVSRNHERAREAAARFNGDAVPFDLLQDYLALAHVVITQTSSDQRILERRQFQKSQKKRGYGSVFVLDLAVPRDVAEDVGELDGVFLYNVDDLEHVVAEHAMERSRELDQCKAIITEESERFLKGFQSYAAGPLITELRARAEQIKQEEIARLMARFPELPESAREEIAGFSSRLMNKLLHPQIQGIKEQAASGNTDSLRMIAEALGVNAPADGTQADVRREHSSAHVSGDDGGDPSRLGQSPEEQP
ncbi:MAG: glutamyl-tRNA reductase [Planctomycetes bacterium]|nr:glutamyl-tRNA reductase [Planctomycetota bacterium]